MSSSSLCFRIVAYAYLYASGAYDCKMHKNSELNNNGHQAYIGIVLGIILICIYAYFNNAHPNRTNNRERIRQHNNKLHNKKILNNNLQNNNGHQSDQHNNIQKYMENIIIRIRRITGFIIGSMLGILIVTRIIGTIIGDHGDGDVSDEDDGDDDDARAW